MSGIPVFTVLLYILPYCVYGLPNKPIAYRSELDDAASQCGTPIQHPIKTMSEKIVNGEPVPKNSEPWLVAVLYHYRQSCGGTIISSHHVLTAAHCFVDRNTGAVDSPWQITVDMSEHDLSAIDGEIFVETEQIILHEKYNRTHYQNDIALLKLKSSIKPFTDTYKPACLPSGTAFSFDWKDQKVMVAGWGAIAEGGASSHVPLKVTLNAVTFEECSNSYAVLLANTICAASPTKDSCQGDSGGPLFYDLDGKRYVVGIVSFGYGCARDGYPGVYTKVSDFMPWIKSKIDAC